MRRPPSCRAAVAAAASAAFVAVAALAAFGAVEAHADSAPADSARADSAPADSRGSPRPPAIRAIRVTGERPRLDGRLDDPAWSSAEFAVGFTQKDPNEGVPSVERTEVAFLYDDEALYVGARLGCTGPAKILSTMSRRDDSGNSERIIVSLDTYHDRRTAYSFAVTASGVRIDYYHPSDNERDRDYSWDPIWEAKAARVAEGWSAEMRIPFSQLRFNATDVQSWGINMNRWTPSRNEDSYWFVVPKSETGWASRFGALDGIEGIAPSRRLEAFPYFASDASFRPMSDPDDPFADESRYGSRGGGDVKMGLGPNLTLEAAVNPDFGQVEADPAEVNLTAFETFFDERRPFFTEGGPLLRGNGSNYFYSRRIGAEPRGGTDGDYEDRPTTTTILGAAKVSGRLPSGLSIAALTALTSREHAETYDASTDAFGKTEIAPFGAYGVVRAQQEFGASASVVGVSLTGVGRDVHRGDPLAQIMTRQAYSGGADWLLRFRGGDYELAGFVGGSTVEGDSLSIVRIQRSSAHYYQRPDADYVTLDSSRTSLSGYTAALRFQKNSGKHWLWGSGVNAESPGFELNDAGRISGADDIDSWASLTYRETAPGRALRNYSLTATPVVGWNSGGVRTYGGLEIESNWTWKNFMSTSFAVEGFVRSQSDVFTRGGPLMTDPATLNVSTGINSNFAANTTWQSFAVYSTDESGGLGLHLNGAWSCRPGGSWQIRIGPSYNRSFNPRQYITSFDGGPEATFGTRYVFASLDRSTLAAQFRVSHSFTPDLSVEVYAEPFAANGHYYGYGELVAARTRDLREYGTDGTTIARNDDGSLTITDGADTLSISDDDFGSFVPYRDFNFLSFRSNVVMRWEWRRGSTFFFVWQQNRDDAAENGRFVGPGKLWDSLSADGENFVAVKLSYWLPVN